MKDSVGGMVGLWHAGSWVRGKEPGRTLTKLSIGEAERLSIRSKRR